jgi:hypothetical protein
MTTHKHEKRKLTELTIHPLLEHSPMLMSEHPDVRNLVAAMMDSGLDDNPIIINEVNQIMDGRHRALAAKLLDWTEIPVTVRPNADALNIIYHALMARRHMYKWQIAYSLAPVIEEKAKIGVTKRVGNLIPGAVHGRKNDQKPLIPSKAANTLDTPNATLFLEQAGIALDTWQRVQEIRKRFEKRPDLMAQYEPRMFLPDTSPNAISLEGVMKALGSTESYEKNKHDLKALRGEHDRLALDLMKKAAAQLEFFDKLEPAKQKKLAEDAVESIRLWPMELKKEILSALQKDMIADHKSRLAK